MSSNTSLQEIQAAFSSFSQLPYCSGTVPLTATTSTLFYTTNGKAELIDFTKPTDSQLSALSDSCQQATFGVNQKDVLDESYRKAGKLDATDFALNFSPFTCGIIDTIRDTLLTYQNDDRSIHAEMYKLNVYGTYFRHFFPSKWELMSFEGPGSFFKAHIDTPRGETMFGSLVIVLPTVHEGGSLIVRHDGHEQVFDTALAVKSKNAPQAAFVAFYSDVVHEVALVTSGYRVTLTYNLYLSKPPISPTKHLKMSNDYIEQLRNSLSALLSDSQFLPTGGLLGFGLSHRYPVNPSTTVLAELAKRLKGSDADTIHICKALSIDVSLKALYTSEWGVEKGACLLDRFVDPGDDEIEDDIAEYLHSTFGGIMINGDTEDLTPIVWIKPLAKSNEFSSPYIGYGNEATKKYAYGHVCLVATIANAAERNPSRVVQG